jgi:hypothetical protein
VLLPLLLVMAAKVMSIGLMAALCCLVACWCCCFSAKESFSMLLPLCRICVALALTMDYSDAAAAAAAACIHFALPCPRAMDLALGLPKPCDLGTCFALPEVAAAAAAAACVVCSALP